MGINRRSKSVKDLEETEARDDCAGNGQQQFNRPTDRPRLVSRESVVEVST
jgi:hypothetical protein